MDRLYLVTGGAGFIGSNMVEHLLGLGYRVRVLDDLSTGYMANLEDHLSNDRFEFIKGSIVNVEDCKNAMIGVDSVIHMAALGSVPRSIDNPIATNEVNVNGFVNVLTAARDAKVERFVYSSSSSVYGDDPALVKKEDTIGNALSPYAVSKRTNELYANVFHDVYGMKVIGLRYFNVFGPKQNIKGPYAAVIPIFISNLLNNKECSINGDGSITRDFTFVKNVVEANYLAANTESEEAYGQVFNIAMGNTTTLNSLYEQLESNIGSGLKANYKENRLGDIQQSLANIDKAKSILLFEPKYEMKDSIKETIDWYKTATI
jgi:UDP-N-acetylglucosamine 4-epimerase